MLSGLQEAVEERGFNYTGRKQPSMDCDAGPWCYWVSPLHTLLSAFSFAALCSCCCGIMRVPHLHKPCFRNAYLAGDLR